MLLVQPGIHLLAHEGGLPGPFAGLVLLALRVHAAAGATGAVHRRVGAIGRCITLDAFEDHGVITHRTAHETALAPGRQGWHPCARPTQSTCVSRQAKLWLCTLSVTAAPMV